MCFCVCLCMCVCVCLNRCWQASHSNDTHRFLSATHMHTLVYKLLTWAAPADPHTVTFDPRGCLTTSPDWAANFGPGSLQAWINTQGGPGSKTGSDTEHVSTQANWLMRWEIRIVKSGAAVALNLSPCTTCSQWFHSFLLCLIYFDYVPCAYYSVVVKTAPNETKTLSRLEGIEI